MAPGMSDWWDTFRAPLPPPPGSHLASTHDGGRTWVHHDRPHGRRASFVIHDEVHHHNPTQESSMAPLPTGTFEFRIDTTAFPDADTAARELRKQAKRIEKRERREKRQRKAQKRAARERIKIREQAIADLRAVSAKRDGYRAVEAAKALLEVTE